MVFTIMHLVLSNEPLTIYLWWPLVPTRSAARSTPNTPSNYNHRTNLLRSQGSFSFQFFLSCHLKIFLGKASSLKISFDGVFSLNEISHFFPQQTSCIFFLPFPIFFHICFGTDDTFHQRVAQLGIVCGQFPMVLSSCFPWQFARALQVSCRGAWLSFSNGTWWVFPLGHFHLHTC